MITLRGRNVNSLWEQGLTELRAFGVLADSRNGPVLVYPSPVVSVYERPTERVLFDPLRDANPFFHLMESLWMLAGRDDAKFLDRYVGDFGSRFAEHADDPDMAYIHGAYGQRWRNIGGRYGGSGLDQLDVVVQKLRANPDDRQAVIQMWDATCVDGEGGRDDLEGAWRDRPCNTHVYLRVRESRSLLAGETYGPVLDLTVLCRSNDIVWGAYGANAVHFSVLQEYLAGRIGVGVGTMYQFSNNWHGYTQVLEKFEYPRRVRGALDDEARMLVDHKYHYDRHPPTPMGADWSAWDADLASFMEWHDARLWAGEFDSRVVDAPVFVNRWFRDTAVPVAAANRLWKMGNREGGLIWSSAVSASDWRLACTEWMQRRMKR